MVILILLADVQAFATVSYYAVNEITKEWTILETGGFLDKPIAWKGVGEKTEAQMENYAIQMGYSFTDFPYKIEMFIFLSLILVTLIILFSVNKNKK